MIHANIIFTCVNYSVRLMIVSLLAASFLISPFALADTNPPTGTPATVSTDVLPTAQIDGIVWATAIRGNTVYAAGKFTQARPAGVPLGGAGSVARANIMAFDLTTGVIDTTFVHSLSGGSGSACYGSNSGAQGCALAVTPDGSKLVVGGSFTSVDGQARNNIAVFDLTTNALLPGYSGTNSTVKTVAATNERIYIGGGFSAVAGQPRSRLAAYTTADGALDSSWIANVTGVVVAGMAAMPTTGNLVVAGSFTAINGASYYSSGAVKLTNGANIPWASQSTGYPIRDQYPADPSASAFTNVSADATQAYLTSFTFAGEVRPSTFEGRAAINATSGNIVWINDCIGDSYASFPIGQVLYSVSHAHSCRAIGGFPEVVPRAYHHALAETTYATGTNIAANGGNYPSYVGQPASTLLNWFPSFSIGSASGISQAGWTLTGNSDYVVIGGEFPAVNGVAQQGLVRFGIKEVAPNKMGPLAYKAGFAIMAYPADASGNSLVRIYGTGDTDNATLTYDVYRQDGTALLATNTMDSRFWKSGLNWTFADTGVTPGESSGYRLVVRDPFGNARTYNNTTAFNDTDSRITYRGDGWASVQDRDDTLPDFARGLHYTGASGASYSLNFFGSSVQLYGERHPGRGTSTVMIDGVAAGTIDQDNSTSLYQQLLFSKTGLGFGRHTITVTNDAGGKTMDVDAIYVAQDRAVDDTSGEAVYSGTWTNRQNTPADANEYGKGVHYTVVNGASVTVAFSGTAVALLDSLAPTHGDIGVSIDGGPEQIVNAYSTSTQNFQVIYQTSGLSAGSHTIKLTKHSGIHMVFDAIFIR